MKSSEYRRAWVHGCALVMSGAIAIVIGAACDTGSQRRSGSDSGVSTGDATTVVPPGSGCGPDTCDGCCAGDTCMPGTANAACGAGGAACGACASGDQRCEAGACVAVPCAERCDGCCSGEVCVGGDSAAACGTGGAECEGCGANEECRTGACHVSATSRWDVMLVSATVPEDNAGGSSWDALGGLPDPKVTLRANDGPTSFQESSESQSDTLTPSWSAVLLENITWRALSMTIGVEVSDADPLGDDFMGSCWEAPTEGNADGGSFTIRCARDTGATPPQTGVSVTLRLRAH